MVAPLVAIPRYGKAAGTYLRLCRPATRAPPASWPSRTTSEKRRTADRAGHLDARDETADVMPVTFERFPSASSAGSLPSLAHPLSPLERRHGWILRVRPGPTDVEPRHQRTDTPCGRGAAPFTVPEPGLSLPLPDC
ncbi:hypothetical protein COO55_01345 [Rhodococcus opacus]|nr:hypothetical protein COO55_01345 [Rhodococcus opacus]